MERPDARRWALALVALLLAGLLSPAALAEPPRPIWNWPIEHPQVLRGFTAPDHEWSSGHRGIDLAAAPGDLVTAIGAGTVAFVGRIAGKPVVSIDHPGTGLRSTYEPVLATVEPGQQVTAGFPIGTIAPAGGHCDGRCLHLGVKQQVPRSPGASASYLDPMTLLRRWAVLKPVHRRGHAGAPG